MSGDCQTLGGRGPSITLMEYFFIGSRGNVPRDWLAHAEAFLDGKAE